MSPPFRPLAWQLAALDALAGAAAVVLATLLRFADEGAVPTTYAIRTLPWIVFAAGIQVGTLRAADRLRGPRSALARRPVLPYLLAALLALAVVLAVNYLLVPLDLRLPLSVAAIGPFLATAASAALRLAAARFELRPDDLLSRRTVRLDLDACAPAIRNKRVLITGAAGSIGSELARQVLAVGPATLTLVDTNETGLFELEAGLAPLSGGAAVRTLMADVADASRMTPIFRQAEPDVVFHAAAYKHVPLVEANPEQGFVTNVVGTLVVCEAAAAVGAERVVVISTDKAVNPTSVMGLTKRAAELIVAALGCQAAGPAISAVRFGNVLGSRGSVLPTLLRQIDAGGPVTITHPDAQRFFMTISEAVSLVLRSAAFGEPGAIFVLDMGEELRIVDLAERLMRLKGLRPGRDVSFVYVGLRPGEKLREELAGDHERLVSTTHPQVRRVEATDSVDPERLVAGVRLLDERRRAGTLPAEALPVALRELIEVSLRPGGVLTAS